MAKFADFRHCEDGKGGKGVEPMCLKIVNTLQETSWYIRHTPRALGSPKKAKRYWPQNRGAWEKGNEYTYIFKYRYIQKIR